MNMQDLPKERHLKFAQNYTHKHPNLNEDLVQHKLNVPMQKKQPSKEVKHSTVSSDCHVGDGTK